MKICFLLLIATILHATSIEEEYAFSCKRASDINEHLPTLRRLASECATITEIGIRGIVSTWALLAGLSESKAEAKSYLGIDLSLPDRNGQKRLERALRRENIKVQLVQANDLEIALPPTDLLFIDTLHTYAHLTFELESFAPSVQTYIVLHDTSGSWGDHDEDIYQGDYSEYPAWIDRSKRGLWSAVVDFLGRHPEWVLRERYLNNNGLTVLKKRENAH